MSDDVVEKNEFIDNIEKEFTIRSSYILLLVFSAVIATLGLLTNSTSVIIGSMLISPLFWPVLGISLSIVFSDRRLIRKALYSFGVSIFTVFAVSFLVTKILPSMEPSQAILVRTNPTLVDLLIALAVSVIGILAIRYKGISQTATGVAISIALLPVLCVVGIGVSLESMSIFKGSLLLFLANAGAIVFVGATVMYFMGIRPKNMAEKEGFKKKYIISFVLLILLAIPLTYHLHVSIKQEKMKKEITNTLTQKVEAMSENASVRDVKVIFPPSFSDEKLKISAIVFLSNAETVSNSDEQEFIEALANLTNDDVNLELSMFNTISIKRDDDAKQEGQRIQIEQVVNEQIHNIDSDIAINSVYTTFPEDDNENVEIFVKVQQIGDKVPLTFDQKQDVNKTIEETLQLSSNLTIEFVPATILEQESDDAKLQQKIENVLEQDVATLSQEASLISATVSAVEYDKNDVAEDEKKDIKVVAVLFVPEQIEVTQEYKDQLLGHIQEEVDKKVELVLQVVNFKDI